MVDAFHKPKYKIVFLPSVAFRRTYRDRKHINEYSKMLINNQVNYNNSVQFLPVIFLYQWHFPFI